MEVLTSYPHHQLGATLNPDVASHFHFGGEPSMACGNEVSLKQSTSFSRHSPNSGAALLPDNGEASEDELQRSQCKEEKDSDAGDVCISNNINKGSKKDKELAQIDYLLTSLPTIKNLFKIHCKIGEGTFSSVFLASLKDVPPKSLLAEHQFAVKHLIPTTHPSRAERELKCLQDIGGFDNVVGVHFCLRHHDSIAFIMPYLKHKRFHEYVMEMGVAETRNYMKQLLLALRRVHKFNIIHRDVKPSNFLYDRETKKFLLVDFGLSQPVEETLQMSSASPPLSVEETRKRKREKEPVDELKNEPTNESYENPTKRQALTSNNSVNIIKTPEKLQKISTDTDITSKSVPQLISNRAKRLQNITNKNCTNTPRASNVCSGIVHLKSPAKDIIETSHFRKTPRKNKNHLNSENISPLKCENQNNLKRASHFDANIIWKDKLSLSCEKHALDLRKVKVEADSNTLPKAGSKSSLQRKILFDDLDEFDDSKKNRDVTPRLPVISPSNQIPSRHFLGRSSVNPMTAVTPSSSLMDVEPQSLSPIDQTGCLGKEFRTLAPENVKDDAAGSSIVRVQNSQVKSQQRSPVTPREMRTLKQNSNALRGEKITEKDQKIIFAKPQAPGSLHRNNTPSSPHCNCVGLLQVCSICLSRKPHNAPRAGTPGFRPPEVLLRSPIQSTAVDMWAVGVILLCILSGCYPFFRSPDDLTALAEIMTVFGTDKIKETAKRLGRLVVCSQPSKPLDLKKLCIRMRQRRKSKTNAGSSSSSSEKCQNCCQPLGTPDSCICLKDHRGAVYVNPHHVNNKEESDDVFPDSAYHLLECLLDLDADTRISAAAALDHPFVTG